MKALTRYTSGAHWLLRIALASVFIYHGIYKLVAYRVFADFLAVPAGVVVVLGLMEIGAAILILAGGAGLDWATRLAGAIIAFVMICAIVVVHIEYGWNSVNIGVGNDGRGMQFQFTLLMLALYFMIVGNRTAAAAPHERASANVRQEI